MREFSRFYDKAKSLTALNMCLDEMEEFQRRDIAFVRDWLTKKRSSKVVFKGWSSFVFVMV